PRLARLPFAAMAKKEKIRLGGMAMPNGVLVHGPSSWACAIRHQDGRIEVASARKRFRASRVENPLLRGPARLAEALALLPQVKAKLPAAKLPLENPRALASMLGAAAFIRGLRGSGVRPPARERLAAVATVAPAVLAVRGGELAAYHGAEHISIGSYEHGKRATREHERCGGHLVGPLIATSAAGNLLAGLAPERHRRQAQAAAQVGAIAAATEVFRWVTRRPDNPVAQAVG